MIIKFNDFLNSQIINESGIRNLRSLIKGYKNIEIYFHKDLDGVATAIATKVFFNKYYGLKLIDCHIIQYGNEQFAVPMAKDDGETLPILVDFASGNPQYVIQFDHHENQRGADKSVVHAKKAKSNAQIVSDEISYSQIFTGNDIDLIKTVDSADFANKGLTPDDIMNVFYKKNSNLNAEQNRFMMGLVVNKLILVYKNKQITVRSLDGKHNHVNKNFLECLVLDSNASLISMYNNIIHYLNNAKSIEYDSDVFDKSTPKWTKTHVGSKKYDKEDKLSPREEILNNLANYIAGRSKEFDKNPTPKGGSKDMLKYLSDYNIILQMNIGDVFKPGSYDRYVPFKNFPDANYLVTMFDMGLIQASGNPFKKKEGDYNDDSETLHMGKIALELLNKVKPRFNGLNINLVQLKQENETLYKKTISKKTDYGKNTFQPIGFTFDDLMNFYSNIIIKDGKKVSKDELEELKDFYNKRIYELDINQLNLLREYEIPVFDIILSQSGGHKGITNISGLNYLNYIDDKVADNFGMEKAKDDMKGNKIIKTNLAYHRLIRLLGNGYVHILKEKIDMIRNGEKITYNTGNLKFDGIDTNESYKKYKTLIMLNEKLNEDFEYYIIQNNVETLISRDEFLKFSFSPECDQKFKIDIHDKKVLGRFEDIKDLISNTNIDTEQTVDLQSA